MPSSPTLPEGRRPSATACHIPLIEGWSRKVGKSNYFIVPVREKKKRKPERTMTESGGSIRE